jgi:uncharacterized membrane protein YkvI
MLLITNIQTMIVAYKLLALAVSMACLAVIISPRGQERTPAALAALIAGIMLGLLLGTADC